MFYSCGVHGWLSQTVYYLQKRHVATCLRSSLVYYNVTIMFVIHPNSDNIRGLIWYYLFHFMSVAVGVGVLCSVVVCWEVLET